MKITRLSKSVSLVTGANKAQLANLQERYRNEFVQKCEESSDTRVPSEDDLDYWWPHTARRNDAQGVQQA